MQLFWTANLESPVIKSADFPICNPGSFMNTQHLPPVPTAVYSNWICIIIQTEIKIIWIFRDSWMSDLKCKTFQPLYMPLVLSGLLKPDWNEGRVFSFLFSGSAKAINYIYSNFFLRYTLSNITPILMNINSRSKFTGKRSFY